MDLHRLPSSGDLARRRFAETRRDVAQASSERVRNAREELTRLSELRARRLESARDAQENARLEAARQAAASRTDAVEISPRGRALAREQSEPKDVRSEHVAELKSRYEHGQVNTPEAIERAATRLLGAE